MAAPSYTTDLAVHNDATNANTWNEPTGRTTLDGSGVNDTDLAIYGNQCVSESMRKTGNGALMTNAVSRTIPTNGGFFVWFKWFAPNSLDLKANGGIEFLIGNSTSAYRIWDIDGSDTYPYGGWKNYFVDPTITTGTTTQGSPNTTYASVGIGVNCPTSSPSKGNSYTIDIVRYGRGETQIRNGELIARGDASDNPGTFAGLANINDNPNTGRWGLFQDQGGSYLYKGLMSFGTSSIISAFKDSGVVITIDNVEFCTQAFNRIEINNANSRIEWDAVSISSLSTTSPGQFECIDNATVLLTDCTFTDMDTFTFQSNTTLTGCVFNNPNSVVTGSATVNGCTFNGVTTLNLSSDATNSDFVNSAQVDVSTTGSLTNCTVDGTTDATAQVLIDNTAGTAGANIDGVTFVNSAANRHAVELGSVTTPTSITWNHLLTTGDYTAGPVSSTSNYTPVSNTNAAIVINGNLSSTLTINAANYDTGGVTPSVRVTGSNTGTIVINLAAQPEISVNILEDDGSTNLTNATIYLEDSASNVIISAQIDADGIAGPFTNTFGTTTGTLRVRKFGWKPYQAAVSIGATTTLNVQMIPDPQQATDRALQTGWSINTGTSRLGYSTGGTVISVQELYEAVMSDFAQTSFMQFPHPLESATRRDYSFVNGWTFEDKDDDYKQLSGGSIVDAANNLTWSNVRSIGSLVSGTNLYILQNDTVLTSWWPAGNIDILVKIEDVSFITTLNDTNTAINGGIWVFAREFGDLYDSFFVDLSALGQSVIALSTSPDVNNTTPEGTVSGGYGITIDYNGPFSYDAGDGNGSKNYETRVNLNGATLKQWYEYSKYITRRGSVITVDGDAGQEYRNANEATFSNADVKVSPFGTFAGGRYFGAQGIQILNPASVDANNWELIASDGTSGISPPVTRSFELTGLKDGTEIRLHRTDNQAEVAGVELMVGGVGTSPTAGVVVTGSTDDNTFTYSYEYSVDIDVFAVVIADNYQYLKISGLTLANSDQSIPVSQVFDRNFTNP